MSIRRSQRKHEIEFDVPGSNSAYFCNWQTGSRSIVKIPHPRDISATATVKPVQSKSVKEGFRDLARKLCEEHPAISTDKGIFGGMPHIKNVRLSVGDVLAKLYVYGTIKDILKSYSPDVNEEQIKEAIAYAQDFLEAACDPREPR